MVAQTSDFEALLEDLAGNNKFQKRLLLLLLCPVFFWMPMAFLNQIFVLHTPDHWCTPVTGQDPDSLNINLTQWKSIFLPETIGPDRRPRPSQCTVYNMSNYQVQRALRGSLSDDDIAKLQQAPCQLMNGWSYDHSEFVDSAVMDNDWVCEKANRVADLFTLGVVGLIIGTAIFSWIADFKGRRVSFYICTAIMILFAMLQIAVSHIYELFVFFKVVSFFAMLPMFQSPMAITTEISSIEGRGRVIGWACIAWSLGNCFFPLIGWLIARWKIIRAVSVLPMVFIFFSWKLLPESPRWLITKGRKDEAEGILRRIGETNGVMVPSDLRQRIDKISEETQEDSYGYLSLFSGKHMALRTILVTIGFTASAFVYYQLVINIGNMAGNTFLNLFLLGLVEGPGNVLGVVLADKVGRRWTHFSLLSANAVLFFALMWIAYDPNLSEVVIFLCMWIKLNISASFVVAYIQAMEIFPTCVRQSGVGFATLISQTISIGGPYVIYLGATDLKLPYMVMFLICLAGCISVMFLPETVGATLPETLEDANEFGVNDKFFSYKPDRSKGEYAPARTKDVEMTGLKN